MVKFVNGENGLKAFSRKEVWHVLELIDFARSDVSFGFRNAEWLLKLKGKLLKYVKMNWERDIVVPKKIDRSMF